MAESFVKDAFFLKPNLVGLGVGVVAASMLPFTGPLLLGVAALSAHNKVDELEATRAYTRLGEALGLDWAQQQVARFVPADQWERLLTAGLARDFEQLRIDFLGRCHGANVDGGVEQWIDEQRPRIDQFRKLVARARSEGHVSAPMLAQIAGQARILLGR